MSHIPESEVNWLYGIDEIHKIEIGNGFVYPVTLLPPNLGTFVKTQDRSTEYVNFGPFGKTSDGMCWKIWGWDTLPNTSFMDGAQWNTTLIATK